MTNFQEIISSLKHTDPSKAEYLEEEIDIITHKLKFLTEDNFPKTIVLDQERNFAPIVSPVLAEKIKIAGGKYSTSLDEDPDCIIFLQSNEGLYGQLAEILNSDQVKASGAFNNNNIYIIQESSFNTEDEDYLKDTEILAEILQPKYFVYGHDGTAWVKFDIQ
jgi:hypothetical protein